MQMLIWFLIGIFVGGFLFYQIGFGKGMGFANTIIVEGNTVIQGGRPASNHAAETSAYRPPQ